MPIISKETWDKFTQEEKDAIRKIYNSKRMFNELNIEIESLFGREQLQQQPLTYEDVAREWFKDKTTFYIDLYGKVDFYNCGEAMLNLNNCTSRKQVEKLLAINKLLNTAKYLNKDWEPDWENIDEEKYYIYINSNNNISVGIERTCVWSIVYFRTEEFAKQAVQILGEDTIITALSTDW